MKNGQEVYNKCKRRMKEEEIDKQPIEWVIDANITI